MNLLKLLLACALTTNMLSTSLLAQDAIDIGKVGEKPV